MLRVCVRDVSEDKRGWEHSSEVLQTPCSETRRFLVGINLSLNGESSRVAPRSLSFLSYGVGLGVVKVCAGYRGGGGGVGGSV